MGDVRTAKAALIADLETTWQHWTAFISERQADHARTLADDDHDDLFASATVPVPAAPIPVAVRRQLETVLERRRQDALVAAEQAARAAGDPLPDPDGVVHALLDQIARELRGAAHPDGLALVWWDGELHAFNHQRVLARMDDADYALAQPRTAPPKAVAVGGGILVLIIGIVVMRLLWGMVMPGDTSGRTLDAVPANQVTVGNDPVDLWDVQTLGWDAMRAPAQVVGGGPPLQVCADARTVEPPAPGATLTLTGTANVRTYQVVAPTSGQPADLVLSACDRPEAVLAQAVLQSAQTSVPGDGSAVVDLLTVSSASDPDAIPPNYMQVVLTLATGEAGTLVLPDGSRWSPTSTSDRDGQTALTYLVPAATAPQAAGLLVPTADGLPTLIPLTLPTPASRAGVLDAAVTVADVVVGLGQLPQMNRPAPVITLTLALDGREQLALQPTDVQWVVDGTPQTPTRIGAWPTLTADGATTLTVPVPETRAGGDLELQLGTWRVALVRTGVVGR